MTTRDDSASRRAAPLKSAYEAALEALEARGIAPPDDDAVGAASRQAIAEARNRAEAKLAELEILHQDAIADLAAHERAEADSEYRTERRRIEERLERELARLRGAE